MTFDYFACGIPPAIYETPRTAALVARHQGETAQLPDNPDRDRMLAHARRQALELLEHAQRLERQTDAERYRAQRAEAHRDALVSILSGIHALLLPGDFEGHDGKVYRFDPPDDKGLYKECYRALGERIRAIPEELDKAAKAEPCNGGGPSK